VAFLTTQAYWARWRGAEDIKAQIAAAWRVVGVYDRSGAMVGFARAHSDSGCAYLSDVYVLPAHRGAGLGQAIVRVMIDEGPGAGLRWMLHTSDAHGLYRQFGFATPRPSVHGARAASRSRATTAAARHRRDAGGQGGPPRAAAAPARGRAGRRGSRRR
jgi:GNAT superfamily N-acetyltransferase